MLKKTISIILAAVLTASVLNFNIFAADIVQEEPTIVYGDVSKDGKVSLADAFMLLASKLGIISLDETQKFYGDVDADGTVGYSDIWFIVRYLLGWISVFPSETAAWTEGEKTEDTHFLDACYKYDAQTGLYEYYLDIIYYDIEIMGTSLRMETNIKGNKKRIDTWSYRINIFYVFDGEKYYIFNPMMATYAELDAEGIAVVEGLSETINFADFLYIGSTKNTFGGIDYICEKYAVDDEYYNFWFTASGKAVRAEEVVEPEGVTYIVIIKAFNPDVDDSLFAIPSNYTKVEYDDLYDGTNLYY